MNYFPRLLETLQGRGAPRFILYLIRMKELLTELNIVCLVSWYYELIYFRLVGTDLSPPAIQRFQFGLGFFAWHNDWFPKAVRNSGETK